MTIALDTNVLWPLLRGDEPAVSILTPLLDGYNASDGLVVCGPVYAELLARFGGDEFYALLPNVTLRNAMDLAERVRRAAVTIELDNPYPTAPLLKFLADRCCLS